ncbi:MAG: glycosyltransferase family 2 protein [Syntrophales bacterium]|jgi:glycosyltransferase involved in cell wall biosynthesis
MKYLNKRAAIRPIGGQFDRNRNYRRAVVIPALAERAHLPLTVESLSNSMPPDILDDTLVLVVVNNRPPESGDAVNQIELREQIDNNAQTLKWLEDKSVKGALRLAWIDASSPGHELPPRGGVGLARKIGCDSVLAFLLEMKKPNALDDFIFFSLDADTIVSPDYLETAGHELQKSGCTGGIISFKHQQADSPESQAAIDEYEAFLNYYVAGLRWAGSPYAFHTVGSCLCFTASGYVRANGFAARRQAGEDFYFCMELAKTGTICEIQKTMVFPSARISRRVAFGTGKRMAEAALNGREPLLAYDFRVFVSLRELLTAVSTHTDEGVPRILAELTNRKTVEFLENRGFTDIWGRFQRQYKTKDALLAAFHRWFDGFVTLKYIHYLTEKEWPRRPLDEIYQADFYRSRIA